MLFNDCISYNIVNNNDYSTNNIYFQMGVKRYDSVFLNLTYGCSSCHFLSLKIELLYTDNNTILGKAILIKLHDLSKR